MGPSANFFSIPQFPWSQMYYIYLIEMWVLHKLIHIKCLTFHKCSANLSYNFKYYSLLLLLHLIHSARSCKKSKDELHCFISTLKELLGTRWLIRQNICHKKTVKGEITLGEVMEERKIIYLYFHFYFFNK